MSLQPRRFTKNQQGFTIVETLLAMSIAAFIITVLFSVTLYYYAGALQSHETANLALESQTILSQMVDELRLADGISATNQNYDANAPSGGWSTNDPSNIIIIQYPALTSSRDIIYDPTTSYPYRNEFVYFLSGKTMYKRTIKNTAATGNAAVTTCPAALATASCPEDRNFSDNVSGLTFTFYDTNNATTSDPSLARSVKLSLTMSKKVFGKTITLSNSTQITQRNQ